MSKNPFSEVASRYQNHPDRLRAPLITRAIGRIIPFVDTAGCYIEEYTPSRVVVRLDNREAVQNHLGGLHAAALALLAETASGLVVAVNVPPEAAPVLRTMDVSFDRFSRDSVEAEASLSTDQMERIQSRPIGRVDVEVDLKRPNDNEQLLSSTLEWAWLPEDRLRE